MDKDLVKHCFEHATIATIRIASFGASDFSHSTKTSFHQAIANQLAHKDLVDLAISATRLTEAADVYAACKAFSVPHQAPIRITSQELGFTPSDKAISLWELFGRIVHSTSYFIYSNEFHIKSRFGLLGSDIYKNYISAIEARNFRPVCELSTDRVPVLIFGLRELASTSLHFLETVADELSEELELGTYRLDS